jgi:hypothetical protein
MTNPYGFTNAHWERLALCARLAGWRGARESNMRSVAVSDSISMAAFEEMKKVTLEWHEQDPVQHPATELSNSSDGYFCDAHLLLGAEPFCPECSSANEDLCCKHHNGNCEPPYELCCDECSEVDHPRHGDKSECVLNA